MKVLVSVLLVLLVVSLILPHSLLGVDAKSAKDSKARRDINKAIGQAVEGKFSSIKTVNISTYTAPNESFTVWNKTSPGSILPKPIIPPVPPVNQTITPVAGYKICMVGDFKDSKVFDAMNTTGCNYRIAVGDNGYSDNLNLLKSIKPDRCVIGNHDSPEDGNDKIYKEALAYCGDSWYTKIGNHTLILGFNTNGDGTKQLNAVKGLFANSQFMAGIKNVIAVSHKGGHVFPSAHHPAEAKTFYTELEKLIPSTIRLTEIAGHNHNAAAAPNMGWYVSGNGGKSFYACGQDKDWTYCNNKTIAYLQATIPDNNNIAFNFIDINGKSIM